jgi:threonine dehydrogenase-like Zn-dependent dehydrogenase
MRVLVVGAGGVGSAITAIAERRDSFERVVLADIEPGRAERAITSLADAGFYTTEPFSEPEVFDFPEGIRAIECVNVEHEEVVLVPRELDCRRVTFKYGLGDQPGDRARTAERRNVERRWRPRT